MSTAPSSAAALHLLDQAARFSRWGRPKAAIEAYRQACAVPLDTNARYGALIGLARSLDAIGESEQAIATCHDAIRHAPELSPAYGVLALLLMRKDRLDEAALAAADACQRDDHSAAMHCLAASIALQRGRVDEAIDAVSITLKREPLNQRAQAIYVIARAWRDGSSDELDMTQLVSMNTPPLPAGFSSMDTFNQTLANAIREHGMHEPRDRNGPLVNGVRLHDLFALPPALADALRTMFLSEARLYASRFLHSGTPSRLAMRGWANVMEAGAYEEPHIHEDGWLSGVYYPQLPEQGSTGGEIVFGPHDLGARVPSPAPYQVSPAVGQMILFPSWLYHSTRPFAGTGFRISVAADILRSD